MIKKAILDAVSRFSLIEKGTTVTVALSGGADSMALLTALNSLKDVLQIKVKAAHLNHLIRGDEAFRDEKFVNEQCQKLGVELICERLDIPSIAKAKGESIELTARNQRYDFLSRINEGVIATAHNSSDNLETVILNLTRGTSIDGLCGIPVKRDIFIRPILFCSRALIEEYCEANEILYVTDSTNLSNDYTRNKIRHNVIPTLKELNPSIENSVLRTCDSLKQIVTSLDEQVDKYLKENLDNTVLSVKGFSALSPAIAKRVIVEFVKICNREISLEACHIEELYNISLFGGKTSIPNDKIGICENLYLKVLNKDTDFKEKNNFSVTITQESNNFFKNNENVNNLFLKNSLDCDKIVGKLVIRTRQTGDSIRLKNRGCTKPLTKLYSECKVPISKRDILPVIADDNGVVWICGIGVAHRVAINEKSKTIYIIDVKNKEI